MRIKPFAAWRPPVELAPKVASLPYDVVDAAEAKALAEGNPYSFFHVSRAEIDLPEGTSAQDERTYRKAAENFRAFRERGTLVQEGSPSFYLYRLTWKGRDQRGFVTVCHVQDYEENVIRKHEKTRQAPENDRTRHVNALNANSGPVFLAYRDRPEIDAAVAIIEKSPPLYDFTAADGIRHTVWRVGGTKALVEAFAKVPHAYIADGHHRAAAAARVARERRTANPSHTGGEEYNWFLAVLFPAGQLRILPYNRCVKDLNGLSKEQFLEAVRARFAVSDAAAPQPAKVGQASMYLDGRWYGLGWTPEKTANPADALDVSVLQDRLLNPVLGIDDPRNNPRIEFVGGIRGTEELEKRVKSGRAAVAFSMYPATLDQLMAISDAGQCMPPKSTWFEPKLRSGLLVHTLD